MQALIGLPVVIWALLAEPIDLQTMREEEGEIVPEGVPGLTLAGTPLCWALSRSLNTLQSIERVLLDAAR